MVMVMPWRIFLRKEAPSNFPTFYKILKNEGDDDGDDGGELKS